MTDDSCHCIAIAPTKVSDSEERIRSAITSSSVLPPSGYTFQTTSEDVEIPHLSSVLGWSNPQGLFGYTKDSEYKDIYIYFDYGDKKSPVNELATKAFEMYGLGGAMITGPPTWGPIRGKVVVMRLRPDWKFSPHVQYNPMLSLEEMYQTLTFFRDSPTRAQKIAIKRDSVRFQAYVNNNNSSSMRPPGVTGPSSYTHYMGPNGLRTNTQVNNDQDKCNHCGKMQALVGKLKQCQRCKVTFYCDKECQKKDWKKHKKICKSL
jgi:hypothetical protein